MPVIDLDSPDLTWGEHAIAGCELPARISMLSADAERGIRSVIVQFPDGWRRDAVGNQPAGEEMVLIAGGISLSGAEATPGAMLVVSPYATRSATSTLDGTRAVVWFSGAGGGWTDGEADSPGTVERLEVGDGLLRDTSDGLAGRVTSALDIAGQTFGGTVEVVWPENRAYAVLEAGSPVPDIAGRAVIRHWD